jgi:hypothetical protein
MRGSLHTEKLNTRCTVRCVWKITPQIRGAIFGKIKSCNDILKKARRP